MTGDKAEREALVHRHRYRSVSSTDGIWLK
jgi:hypothetical protein